MSEFEASAAKFKGLLKSSLIHPTGSKLHLYGLSLVVKKPSSDQEQD